MVLKSNNHSAGHVQTVFAVQPALSVDSEVSKHLRQQKDQDIVRLRESNDVFSQIIGHIQDQPDSKSVGVSTSVESLFHGISHFAQLASLPIVIHVPVYSSTDFGLLAAIRQSGFVFVQSFNPQDTQDVAAKAYSVASRLSKPVVHIYNGEATGKPLKEIQGLELAEASEQPELTVTEFGSKFQYFGSKSATNAIVVFGASSELLEQAVVEDSKDTGIVKIRVYRPFDATALVQALPKSVSRLAFAEQIGVATTQWGPLVQDFVSQTHELERFKAVVGVQLGRISSESAKTVIKGIVGNLESSKPVQNIRVGEPLVSSEEVSKELQDAHENVKSLEHAYISVLRQLFKDDLDIINESQKQDAGVGSPEYGFGKFLAQQKQRENVIDEIKKIAKTSGDAQLAKDITEFLVDNSNNNVWTALEKSNKNVAEKGKELFKTPWLIGSDAWAYDLGHSGVHHVISSGENVNMLVIDSEPYSEVVRRNSAKKSKKDVGLYAMNFGNVYVASVAVYGSYTQLLLALTEAQKFDGPSVVVAYLPYHSEMDDALTVLQETKKAIDTGYWPLYRYNPTEQDTAKAFQLDSFQVRKNLKEFLERENKLSLLSRQHPEFSRSLENSYEKKVKQAQKQRSQAAYQRLLEGLGPGVTVLFASDGGQAESVAKRLGKRATARGLVANVVAFDEFSVEDELAKTEYVIFVTSTAGQGEFPQNGRQFWEALKGATDLDLTEVNFAVFGMGDSEYWPRKQDKIYYNKPAKDLYNRLTGLKGKEMAPLALGDDQDADGWSTAYGPWETALWEALNVSGQGVEEEEKVITNEDIKLASNYLRGTIAEGLKDKSTGAISAHDQQLTKFHGIYMQDDRDVRDARKQDGLEPAYSFMVRVRLPGCVASPDQWLRIHDLSDERGNGTFKITTRGTFQLHGVIKEDLKPAIRGMNAALIDTVGACGDVNRNVVGAALTTNAKIHKDVADICDSISEHLLAQTTAYHEIWLEGPDEGDGPDYEEIFESREKGPKKKKKELVNSSTLVDVEPLYGDVYLPRKFKINIAVPPYNDVDVYAHDIGLIGIVDEDTNTLTGFNVLVGGGMGVTHNNKKTYPRTGSMMGFVPIEKSIEKVCEAVMLVQRDFGDRKNRKHARLKYTVDDIGVDQFREKVEERMGYKFDAAAPFEFVANTDQFGWTQDETGKHHFTTFVENGRVENTPELQFKEGLKQIALKLKEWNTGGHFRLTANQHIIISDIDSNQVEEVKRLLEQYKLDNLEKTGLRLSSAACVAFPTCGLAMAESERYLPVLIDKLEDALEEYGLRHDSIVMRMTGCPNGCARPWLAEVALVGKAYGAYNLMLGGGFHGQRLNKLYRSSIKEEEILSILKPLFKRWALERQDGERFGDFLIRVGVIAETTEGKKFWENVVEE